MGSILEQRGSQAVRYLAIMLEQIEYAAGDWEQYRETVMRAEAEHAVEIDPEREFDVVEAEVEAESDSESEVEPETGKESYYAQKVEPEILTYDIEANVKVESDLEPEPQREKHSIEVVEQASTDKSQTSLVEMHYEDHTGTSSGLPTNFDLGHILHERFKPLWLSAREGWTGGSHDEAMQYCRNIRGERWHRVNPIP